MSEIESLSTSYKDPENIKPNFGFGLKVLLCVISFFSIISMTIAMPILPVLAKYFHVDKDTAQQISSIIFLGSAFSGLIYGPLSDSFGRKKILIFTLIMYTVFSFLSSFATTIEMFMLLQFLQGLHVGSGAVIVLAIAKDAFEGASAAKTIASLGLVIPLAPATAPLLGGYLEAYYGWQSIYIFIAISGIIVTGITFFYLPETHQKNVRLLFSPKLMMETFLKVIRKREFLQYAVMLALAHASMMMYNVTAVFMFVQQLGVELQHFGYYQMFSVSGIIVGNFIINRFVMDYGLTRLLRLGSLLCLIAPMLFFIVMIEDIRDPFIFSMCMFVFNIGVGCVFSTAMPLSMSTVPEAKGYTASLVRLIQLGGTAISTAVIAEFYNHTFWPMLLVFMTFGFIIFIFGYRIFARQEN